MPLLIVTEIVLKGGEKGDDIHQRATGRIRTLGCYGKDSALVHGTPALPGELQRRPVFGF